MVACEIEALLVFMACTICYAAWAGDRSACDAGLDRVDKGGLCSSLVIFAYTVAVPQLFVLVFALAYQSRSIRETFRHVQHRAQLNTNLTNES